VSIHTFSTPRRSDPEERPILRLTEEFWSKEWVQRIFKKLKELDSPKRTQSLMKNVYQAMVDGATGNFVSKKTIGVDINAGVTPIKLDTQHRQAIFALMGMNNMSGYFFNHINR